MRILITGSTGFIGRAVALALLRQGHELVCAVRDPDRLQLGAGRWRAIQADFARVPSSLWWLSQLEGVDAVINTVGIIRERPGQSFDALHARAPAELFRACVQAGVRQVIQISALGADSQAQSRYHLSKKVADDVLRSLPLAGAVVQPSLVYGTAGASAAMFNVMAAAPLLMLPMAGRMQVQPVHVDDVVEGIVSLLRSAPEGVQTIAFAGPRPIAMARYLRELRAGLGVAGPLPVLPLPAPVFMAGARLASLLPGSVLDTETAAMLMRGSIASAERFSALLGRAPREVDTFVEPQSSAGLRVLAVLGLWGLVLRVALAVFWLWTGLLLLGMRSVRQTDELLARGGVHGGFAAVALYGAGALGLVLGVLTLGCPARWRRALWAFQAILMGVYTAIVSVFLPEYWLHPDGSLIKNLPILAAIGLLWALEPGSRHRVR